jgi:hypothetical protein
MAEITEYLDWSDGNYEKWLCGNTVGKYGEIDFAVEDGHLVIYLRRGTSTKRDLTIFVSGKGLARLMSELEDKELNRF